MAPYTELDIFPALPIHRQEPQKTPRRRGLASLPFAFTLPDNTPSFKPSGGSAAFLDSLRRRTLLDLSCMREFSLLRTKPLADRNLSRLSVTSAYNMHTEQLHLQTLAAESPRQASPVKPQASDLVGLRSRIARTHGKNLVPHTEVHQAPVRAFIASPPVKPAPKCPQKPKSHPVRPRTEPSPSLSVAEQHGFLQEQDLAALMAATGYSRAELFSRWARFKALCSMAKNSHGVDKETLRHGVPQLSGEDQFFVDRAFDVLDTDGSGALDWPEFIAALSALEKGDASRRIAFLFHAYDLNGDGFIQRQEVQQFFLASLLVPQTPQALEVARHFVDKIFISLGRENNDSIRVEDAMTYLHQHPATDAYSILGRTMVSTPPSTPVPVGIRPRRRPNRVEQEEPNKP
ncbi:hypothetical protein V7S43_012637 [Phytophthora oleae]|uniref:EF-hand domain-containing protein n=1 Tax=Phytophthora oleae TaxID=2107226 RepID=A0ABD3F625_9STRA